MAWKYLDTVLQEDGFDQIPLDLLEPDCCEYADTNGVCASEVTISSSPCSYLSSCPTFMVLVNTSSK